MITLKAFFSGFLSFAFLQIFNLAYLTVMNILKPDQINKDIFLFLSVISIAFVGLIGGLIFISFTKIYKKLPFTNLYIKSGFYHALYIAILSTMLIIKKQFTISTVVLIAASSIFGALSMYLFSILTKKEKNTM